MLATASLSAAVLVAPAASKETAASAPAGQDPGVPGVVVGDASQVAMEQTRVGVVRLWQSPTAAGSFCAFLQVPDLSSAALGPVANGGAVCELGRHRPQTVPIVVSLTWLRSGDGFVVMVDGHVAAGIARIELVSGTTRAPLPLDRGYFLGSLTGNGDAELPADSGPYALIAYAARGVEVARLDLQEVVAQATPSDRQLHGRPAGGARVAATCTPSADVPWVNHSTHQGYGKAVIWCGEPPPTYYYRVELRNRAGSTMSWREGWYTGLNAVNTATVGCAGAYVKSFLWINLSGTGKSDTSPEEPGVC